MKLTKEVQLKHLDALEDMATPAWVDGINWGALNIDSSEGIIIAKQLEWVENKVYEAKYPMNHARSLFNVNREVPAGAESVSYSVYAGAGSFNLIKDYRKDFEGGSEQLTEDKLARFYSFGRNIYWTVQEIRAANMAGMPLSINQMADARRNWENKLEDIVWNGEKGSSLKGFLSTPDINTAVAGQTFAASTPAQMLDIMLGAVNDIIANTNGVEAPDTLLMPIAQHQLAATTFFAETGTTVLAKFLEINGSVTDVRAIARLSTAVAGGPALVAYNKLAENQEIFVSQEFESFAPQIENMAFTVTCHARTAGLAVRYPKSISVVTGI